MMEWWSFQIVFFVFRYPVSVSNFRLQGCRYHEIINRVQTMTSKPWIGWRKVEVPRMKPAKFNDTGLQWRWSCSLVKAHQRSPFRLGGRFLDAQGGHPPEIYPWITPKSLHLNQIDFPNHHVLVSMLNFVGAKDLHHPRYTWPLFHLMVGSSIKNGIDARLTLRTWLHGEAHQVASTSSKLRDFFPRQKFWGAIFSVERHANISQLYFNSSLIVKIHQAKLRVWFPATKSS